MNLVLEHTKGDSLKNLAIEVNSYKFSQNATYVDCCTATVLACADLIAERLPAGSGVAKVCGEVKKEFGEWGELFEKLAPRTQDAIGIVEGVERMVAENAKFAGMRQGGGFRFLLQTLYDDEVLSEGVLLLWAEKRAAGEGGETALELFNQKSTQDFLDWLNEDEESDEESGEESD